MNRRDELTVKLLGLRQLVRDAAEQDIPQMAVSLDQLEAYWEELLKRNGEKR